jgi:signal transduction histidine kinase
VRLNRAGRRLDVAMSVSPIRDPAGAVVGAAQVVDDITERRREEEELLAAKEAAEEASRAKSRFLANVSHELRTPLNAIIGYSEMLCEDAAEHGDGRYVADLTKIREAGLHLLALISDVLDLSKVEAGRMVLYLEEFAVAGVMRDAASTLAPLAARNRNRLEVDCPPTWAPCGPTARRGGSACSTCSATRRSSPRTAPCCLAGPRASGRAGETGCCSA